jgi:hypothetical protein
MEEEGGDRHCRQDERTAMLAPAKAPSLSTGRLRDGSEIDEWGHTHSLDILPEELVAYVLHFLGPEELLSSAAVCRQWRRLADSSPKWRDLALSRWPPTTCDPRNYAGSWKSLYLDRNRYSPLINSMRGAFAWLGVWT